jgi:formylglycine-generating enzyme required for sulfatase activity
LRGIRCWIVVLMLVLLAGCARDPDSAARKSRAAERVREGIVTVSGDDSISETLTWRVPAIDIPVDGIDASRRRADAALAAGHLFAEDDAAIPVYVAILKSAPDDVPAHDGLQRAVQALIVRGDASLALAGDDIAALRDAHQVAAVARAVAADDDAVQGFLQRLDTADNLWELNRDGEHALANGDYGERSGGALAKFREALALQPAQPRAMQGIAAVESAMIRSAEDAAESGDFAEAMRWLGFAAQVRPGSATVPDAGAWIERMRSARIARLHDLGIAALGQREGIASARKRLAEILLIAPPGNPVAAELRESIDLAEHYGTFRPGQNFTDALKNGARGPQMIVVPHGAFRMGSADDDAAGRDDERPQRAIRFDRGFAMSVTEVTVGEYRRFADATGHKTRAERRGFSLVYDEQSGNFARRSDVDWRRDYAGWPAADDQPVLHLSAKDADAYAKWLAAESGANYRLPSEAEFEYALRAGGSGAWPWGDGPPPVDAGNLTGTRDRSPGGRHWSNAFAAYGDGAWGPAPVGRYRANAWGVEDLAGNVSEWVADCWHDNYRRAPKDGGAWVNPGCRTRVTRGGSWAGSPAQTRSAWRAPVATDATSARIGFRVVRDL